MDILNVMVCPPPVHPGLAQSVRKPKVRRLSTRRTLAGPLPPRGRLPQRSREVATRTGRQSDSALDERLIREGGASRHIDGFRADRSTHKNTSGNNLVVRRKLCGHLTSLPITCGRPVVERTAAQPYLEAADRTNQRFLWERPRPAGALAC